MGFPIHRFQVQNNLSGSKIELAFHRSEVDQMSAMTYWGISGKVAA